MRALLSPAVLVYFGEMVVPQPRLTALPQKLVRKCCAYKSCGNTELYLVTEFVYEPAPDAGPGLFRRTEVYGYCRASNDDMYFSYQPLEKMLELVNDPEQFPVM